MRRFSGLDGADVNAWLRDFEDMWVATTSAEDTNEKKAAWLRLHLDAPARELCQGKDFDAAKAELEAAFASIHVKEIARAAFNRRTHKPSETYEEFGRALSELGRRADPDIKAKEVLRAFWNGIDDATFQLTAVGQAACETMKQAVGLCVRVNMRKARTAQQPPPPPSAVAGISDMQVAAIAALVQSMAFPKGKGRHRQQRPSEPFTGKCFNCGKVGHRRNECRSGRRIAPVVDDVNTGFDH